MKLKNSLVTVFFLLSIGVVKAQEADQVIGSLINQSDWFSLEEAYPKVKSQIQSEMLKLLSESMISRHFNKPDKAVLLIDSLLKHHQQELGFESSCNMVALKSQILAEEGHYAESADNATDFLNQIKTFCPVENFPTHVAIAKYYNRLRNEPRPAIIRPDKDTEVPLFIEKAGKGTLMLIPVTVKGKVYRFIFDTGAGSTFVSERFANEAGLRIVHDSLTIMGVGTGVGKMGTIDSLMIGDILFEHPMITIAPPNPAVDTIYQVDAVLGLDFIKRIGETQIFPNAGKIVFPVNQSAFPETGRNLLIQDGQPYLKVYDENERLFFHFDTGNASADLFVPYYLKHKEQIETQGTRDTIRGGGFGGIKYVDGYKLPGVSLKIGTTNFELHNIAVTTAVTGDFQKQEDGSLGMDFIKLFKKVTINFDKMFVDVAGTMYCGGQTTSGNQVDMSRWKPLFSLSPSSNGYQQHVLNLTKRNFIFGCFYLDCELLTINNTPIDGDSGNYTISRHSLYFIPHGENYLVQIKDISSTIYSPEGKRLMDVAVLNSGGDEDEEDDIRPADEVELSRKALEYYFAHQSEIKMTEQE